MDFDGDGRNDVISGSYNPGYLFVFRNLEDGSYASGERIKDVNGKSINVGYAAHVFAADWDNDKDLDLVIGNISGEVYLVRNEGEPGKNAFGPAQPLAVGEQRIKVAHGDAGPVLEDWDGDGLLDLVVGAGDGSVTFYRNQGTRREPSLAEGRLLIAASESDQEGCGRRTKLCVTDYDGDGRLDLLVGDFAYLQQKPPELTPEQAAQAEKAQEEYQAVIQEYSAAYQKTELPKLNAELRNLQKEPEGETAEQAKAREEKTDQLMEKIQAITKQQLQPLLDRMIEISQRLPNRGGTYHGFVWVYSRRAP